MHSKTHQEAASKEPGGESTDEFPPTTQWQSWMESAASYTLGQFVLKRLHSVLWTIEKTIKWIEPKKREGVYIKNITRCLEYTNYVSPGNYGGDEVNLTRPLPWILFLPTMLIVRCVCFATHQTSVWKGDKKPIDSTSIVASLQWARRNVRSVRLHGLRAIRQNRLAENQSFITNMGKWLKAMFSKQLSDAEMRKMSKVRSLMVSEFKYSLKYLTTC